MDIPGPGLFKNLLDHQKQALRAWLHEVENEGEKVGLWVYGQRSSGTTYIGSIAMHKFARDREWEYVQAKDLMEAMRSFWSTSSMAKSNPSDYDLFMDAFQDEKAINRLWDVDFLWLDDWVGQYTDMNFWMRHVQQHLDGRVKQHKPTIICTDMAPDHSYLEMITQVIKDRFVTCYAER